MAIVFVGRTPVPIGGGVRSHRDCKKIDGKTYCEMPQVKKPDQPGATPAGTGLMVALILAIVVMVVVLIVSAFSKN